MKRGRRITAVLLALLMAMLCCGCGSSSETVVEPNETKEKKLQIGLSFDSFVIERWLRDRDVFVSTAQDLGAVVNVQNANGRVEEQIKQIRYFISKGMDVIVIIAIDGQALQQVVKEAHEKDIKVISYDRLIVDGKTDLYISFDNVMVGKLMGEQLKESLPEGGRIFGIYGSERDHNVGQVRQGLDEALEGSGIEIVYSEYCANWLAELAFDAVNHGLEQGFVPDGVMCGNDDLASQAIKALAEHRLAGNVPVVAQDAELSACQRIVEGTQTMTVYKSVETEARMAAKLAVAMAKGEDITSEDSEIPVSDTIDVGSQEVPYYHIDPVAVTADNMDSAIIGSGFHRREDVYLNVGSMTSEPDAESVITS